MTEIAKQLKSAIVEYLRQLDHCDRIEGLAHRVIIRDAHAKLAELAETVVHEARMDDEWDSMRSGLTDYEAEMVDILMSRAGVYDMNEDDESNMPASMIW
jgi:hypothetical protein